MAETAGMVDLGGSGGRVVVGERSTLFAPTPGDLAGDITRSVLELNDGDPVIVLANAIDGRYDYRSGEIGSFKAQQSLGRHALRAAVRDGDIKNILLMGDVVAMAKALPILTTANTYPVLGEADPESAAERRTLVLTFSTGVGTALHLPDGTVVSLQGGHEPFSPTTPDQRKVVGALSKAARQQGLNDEVIVEQVVGGNRVGQVLDILEPEYRTYLDSLPGDDLNKKLTDRAAAGDPQALRIVELRLGVLGQAVHAAARVNEADLVVVSGGGSLGHRPWLVDPDGPFVRRLGLDNPQHYSGDLEVIGYTEMDLGLRGAELAARQRLEELQRV